MLARSRSSKFVDTKYAEKAAIAQTDTTPAITTTATNPRRRDCEHRVHVVDRDEEYPRWHTEQSAPGTHTGEGVVGGLKRDYSGVPQTCGTLLKLSKSLLRRLNTTRMRLQDSYRTCLVPPWPPRYESFMLLQKQVRGAEPQQLL